MIFSKNITIALLSIFIISCSNSGDGHGESPVPENGSGIIDEKGDFSYSFKMNEECFGSSCDAFKKYEKCETEQKFGSKLDYCRGLQDATLNNNCAVSKREKQFQKDCATNFEEINVGGISGGTSNDRRLGELCKWEVDDFPTRKEWCVELANEDSHGYCMWDYRRRTFKQERCKGSFSSLSDDLAFYDNGVKALKKSNYSYFENNYITYEKFRKSFKISPIETKVFSVSGFNRTISGACTRLKKTKYVAKLVDLDSSQEEIFDPVNEAATLLSGGNYLVVFDIYNDGLCEKLHWKLRVQID